MEPIPSARNGFVLPIIKFFDDMGTPLEKYFGKYNISSAVFENPEIPLPLPLIIQVIAKMSQAEGINNLGIEVAKKSRIIDTGMFGYLLSQSLNTYDLVKRLCYFIPYAISPNGEQFWIQEDEENIWLCQSFISPLNLYSGFYHTDYYSLILILDSLQLTLGNLALIPEIHVASSAEKSQGLDLQLNLPNTHLYFNQPFTAICIPRKILAKSIKKSLTIPKPCNLKEWQANAPALDFVESLQQTIKILLLEKYPTIDITAEAIGLSVRSLQRYLSQQNLTYSRLIDKVRYEWALSLLNNPDLTLIEIAYTLGFKHPANFTHSFRRWAGVSPSQFRQYLSSD